MIPEAQLATWSNQGGTQNSIAAHKSIRSALEALDSPIHDRDFEIFLQGSYKNSTNIRADNFYATNNEGYDEGLEFVDAAGNYTINFPKLHIANGEARNSQNRTNGHYKPAVRMFKNARYRATERGFLDDAPSYFVECLLYNVPDVCFTDSMQGSYADVVNHLSAHIIDA